MAKVGANVKSDASDTSNASNTSKIDTLNIDVNRSMGEQCIIKTELSLRVSLRYQALCDAQSDGEGADTGKFDAKKRDQKRGNKI